MRTGFWNGASCLFSFSKSFWSFPGSLIIYLLLTHFAPSPVASSAYPSFSQTPLATWNEIYSDPGDPCLSSSGPNHQQRLFFCCPHNLNYSPLHLYVWHKLAPPLDTETSFPAHFNALPGGRHSLTSRMQVHIPTM